MSKATNETAVREYLDFLIDPTSGVDDAAVTNLQEKLAQTDNVIDKLALHDEIFAAENPDVGSLEDAFVKHADGYAEDIGLTNPVGSFTAIDVPKAVLRLAFPNMGRASGGPRIGQDIVLAAIPVEGTFTIKELMASTGASRGTIVKALEETCENVGPDPEHTGKGQAASLYQFVV